MELYDASWEYLSSLPTVQEWPELKQLLARGIAQKLPHWRLPALASVAVGGTVEQAIPAVAAMGSLFLSIILIDDMLDADPKGQHHALGHAATANIASALQAIGLEAIAHGSASGNSSTQTIAPATQAMIMNQLNRMILQTALGQHWDVQNPSDEESFWRVARTKSTHFFGKTLSVGALWGGATETTAMRLGEVGSLYGEIIQLSDDLNDVMELPANVDWLQGRYPLPILFATLVPHPERERFISLRPQVGAAWALQEAQEILIRCGAMSYTIDQLLQRYQQVNALLQQTVLVERAAIQQLVDDVIAPVQKLLIQVNLPLNVLEPR